MLRATHFVKIGKAPIDWTEELVLKLFGQYGPIDEVTLRPPRPNRNKNKQNKDTAKYQTQTVLIEFANIDDASAAVEGVSLAAPGYTASFQQPESTATYIITEKPKPIETYKLVTCEDKYCLGTPIVDKGDVFCSLSCYLEHSEWKGRYDVLNKFFSSLGRGGTGLHMQLHHKKIDGVIVNVDPEGIRSTTFYPPVNKTKFDEEIKIDFYPDILK